MKKLMVISAMLLAVSGFANSNSMANTQKMVKSEKVVVEVMENDAVVSLMGADGQTGKAMLSGDLALLNIGDKNYTLKKIKSASGEMFANVDKTVVLGIKGTGAFVEINGEVTNFEAMQQIIEEIVLNYHSIKGEPHSHVLAVLKGDNAFVRIDGMEYNLEKIVSASGEMFANTDKTIVLGIKGTEAFVEMNGKVANYFQVGKASKGYASNMEHEHK
ncbi:hypothetical protein [Streptobacillus ratti]|uniref:hypothetical protein n=1 Tax=Streptobacillus ratti TaxID=1720557 RepID=UPI0009345A90|nr:hypothetical protein [Streptobacillus ratti]